MSKLKNAKDMKYHKEIYSMKEKVYRQDYSIIINLVTKGRFRKYIIVSEIL